jgi:hypothetical protein
MSLNSIPTAAEVLKQIRARQQELDGLKQMLRAAKAAEKIREARAEVRRHQRRKGGHHG